MEAFHTVGRHTASLVLRTVSHLVQQIVERHTLSLTGKPVFRNIRLPIFLLHAMIHIEFYIRHAIV